MPTSVNDCPFNNPHCGAPASDGSPMERCSQCLSKVSDELDLSLADDLERLASWYRRSARHEIKGDQRNVLATLGRSAIRRLVEDLL